MNRLPTFLLSPEAVLTALTAAVYWYCSRHTSGQGRDVEVLERLVMILPLLVVPLVFATGLVPGARNWGWLARVVGFTFVALGVGAGRIIDGFGTGAKGQDVAFIMVLALGLVLVALGSAIAGALILADTRPAFADWFRARRVIASLLTLLAAFPIGIVLGAVLSAGLGLVLGVWSAFKR